MLELIGKKVGMSHVFNESGSMIPLTMIYVEQNIVLSLRQNDQKNFDHLVLGFEKNKKINKVVKSVAGVFIKNSLPVFNRIKFSRVRKGVSLKIGDEIKIDSVLTVGDKISISGITTGKGFAGVMKRWNFRGLEASHGVSVSHRSHGSTGQGQDPGKVFKGKKMAGHLGVEKVTIKNLEVALIDEKNSIIAVRGAIPGKSGSKVVLKITKGF